MTISDNDEDDILGEVVKPKKGAVKAVDARGGQNGAVALGESTSTGNESSRLSVSVLTESSVALDDKQPAQGVSTYLHVSAYLPFTYSAVYKCDFFTRTMNV